MLRRQQQCIVLFIAVIQQSLDKLLHQPFLIGSGARETGMKA
jgi:hypothetical protein